jgi:hypothetical protein
VTTTVLGRPVNGEITRRKEKRHEQRPGEEFVAMLDSLLIRSNVHSVRWTQYTPYFNDGEPCIFGINDITVRLENGDDTAGDYGDGYISTYEMTDGYGSSAIAKPGFEDIAPALKTLNDYKDHFEDFVEEAFGDHATVTATLNGFDIAFYEHD